jgi:4-hydroxybenzoate polyprenyltransferase
MGFALWVGGFDILYALQDEEFDRQHGLHSIPSRYGRKTAIRAARIYQALAVVCLLAAGVAMPEVGAFYFAGVAVTGALLLYEHSLVSADDLSKLGVAFFNVNALISALFCVFVILDRVIR